MGGRRRTEREKLKAVQPLEGRPTLEDRAYEELKRAITDGALLPGGRISVNAMAKRLGISRLPVIHALRRLASEGFVQLHAHKNVVVTKPSRKDIRGRYLVLAALEEVALREAWPLDPKALTRLEKVHGGFSRKAEGGEFDEGLDHAFHEVVWAAPEVDQLRGMIENLWELGAYYRTLVREAASPEGMRASAGEHGAILRALKDGDLEEAVLRVKEHRMNGLRRLEKLFADRSDLQNLVDTNEGA